MTGTQKSRSFIHTGDQDEFDPGRWSPGNLPSRSPDTSLKVLVVGAGPAGLVTALECWRKGHTIAGILERSESPVYTGDIIIMGPSALTVFRHWPDVLDELEQDKTESNVFYKSHTGEHILGPTTFGFENGEYEATAAGTTLLPVAPHQVRVKFYQTLLRQTARIGVKIHYGQRAERYFEDELSQQAGVVTTQGQTWVADLVVAADASNSASTLLIAGQQSPTKSAGMSVYRTALPTTRALANSHVEDRWGAAIKAGKSSHEFWLGPGMHLGLMVGPEFITFGLTPRDSFVEDGGVDPIESWIPDVQPDEVVRILNRVPGWHPAVEGIIRSALPGAIVHWPLLWRDLRAEWTSKGGRVVQVGDAAHSSIPASGSGGTLALEDAITLATCLELACANGGSAGAPAGARTYNLLRYERISCAQKMAFVNAEILGASDKREIKQDPEKVRVRFPKWLVRHDPEAYVYERYDEAYAHIACGSPFQNTNSPPGHHFEPWTVDQVYEDIRAGKRLEEMLDGDWS
nr:fad-dependent monooxygenase mdpd [Quercus suber]